MRRHDAWIPKWNPEDEKFWEAKGKSIARRNLIWSIFAEHLGFSIWLVWSIVATKLPQAGFHYTTDQLFQLVAVPGLIGSLIGRASCRESASASRSGPAARPAETIRRS